jgi:hypothetical protein
VSRTLAIDIPLDLAESVAEAIYARAWVYRSDKGHSPDDIAQLCEVADRMDALAEEIGLGAGRMAAAAQDVEGQP